MASCGTCGAEGLAPGAACPQCGAMPAPDLDLRPRAAAAKPAAAKKAAAVEVPLELAVDPRMLMEQRALDGQAGHAGHGPAMPPSPSSAASPSQASGYAPPPSFASSGMGSGPRARPAALATVPSQTDLEVDAHALADYGDAPGSLVLAPLYAWRVFKRQRELKAALAIRQAEAEHAQAALDDALVAFAERARPVAEKHQGYLTVLEELTRAEEQLRSRDRVLAAEQDAQRERLAQVDARIARAEGELAQAQGHERAVATELSGAQGAMAREEAKIKRAETELRAAQQREGAAG